MQSVIVVSVVALVASTLTFFSGFGLGTVLLPAFAIFYPVEQAVALTAAVHFLTSLFKLGLVGRLADRRIVVAFGVPAIAAAFLGAWLLLRVAHLPPVAAYTLLGRHVEIVPAKFLVGFLLLAFTWIEFNPAIAARTLPTRLMPLGGFLSGFFGGLAGMQGALRSAFLIRAGLSKEVFIGTGVVIACLIDVSRLGVYVPTLLAQRAALDYGALSAATLSAFAGAVIGNRYLRKVTLESIHRLVAVLLGIVAVALMAGWV